MNTSFRINRNFANLPITTETRKQKSIFEKVVDVAEIQP